MPDTPTIDVTIPVDAALDCYDSKNSMYLQPALASEAATIVSSNGDLLSLEPLAHRPHRAPGRLSRTDCQVAAAQAA